MQICESCFNDDELRLAIQQESMVRGVCDACGSTTMVTDAEFLSDFFGEVLSLFVPCGEGLDVVTLLQRDWNLFVSDVVGRIIVEYFLAEGDFGYTAADKVGYSDIITQTVKEWDILKERVMTKTRFFTSLSSFEKLGLISYNMTIPQNTSLFRARVIPSGKSMLGKEEMGCPPADKATAGRANPMGIPYLYLCKNEETTYYEVRALYLDRLVIGTFSTSRELKILDFTKPLSLYVANLQSSDLAMEVSKYLLLQRISKDLSKPLRRFDTELEYVPTQLICEFCKLHEIDGIMFNSSLHKGGVNVVLFDADNAECAAVKQVEINRVDISSVFE